MIISQNCADLLYWNVVFFFLNWMYTQNNLLSAEKEIKYIMNTNIKLNVCTNIS